MKLFKVGCGQYTLISKRKRVLIILDISISSKRITLNFRVYLSSIENNRDRFQFIRLRSQFWYQIYVYRKSGKKLMKTRRK